LTRSGSSWKTFPSKHPQASRRPCGIIAS
jgi:hypothetical protein